MRSHLSLIRLPGPLLAASCLFGCSLVSDLARFEQAAPGDSDAAPAGSDAATPGDELGCSNPRTLCVRLENWPHLDRLAVVDLVSEDNNLRARAILDPFGVGDSVADIVLPLAIPEDEVPAAGEDHPLHLEIWADAKLDGEYSPDADHDWKVKLPPNGNLVFPHNGIFTDLVPRPRDIGPAFKMRFKKMQGHVGRMLEVMVIEESGRTVGMARVQSMPASGEFEVIIPGILDPGAVYRVEFYADADGSPTGNRRYDGLGLGKDHSWVEMIEANDDGVDIEFSHNIVFKELEYQFDFEE